MLPGQVFSVNIPRLGGNRTRCWLRSLALPLELRFPTWGTNSLGRITLHCWDCPLGTGVSSSISGSTPSTAPPSCDSPEQLHALSDVPWGQNPPPTPLQRSRASPERVLESSCWIFSACHSLAFCFLSSPLVVELCEHAYFVRSQT